MFRHQEGEIFFYILSQLLKCYVNHLFFRVFMHISIRLDRSLLVPNSGDFSKLGELSKLESFACMIGNIQDRDRDSAVNIVLMARLLSQS